MEESFRRDELEQSFKRSADLEESFRRDELEQSFKPRSELEESFKRGRFARVVSKLIYSIILY